MNHHLEIACFNKASALIAAQNGADRIEFAADYASGGITPNPEDFSEIKSRMTIPVYVLIRPRAGDFCYSDAELSQMKNEISAFRQRGADGFVFGCLDNNRNIDKVANASLFSAAAGLPCTFHRAFDRITDMNEALEQVIDLGFSNILTSGGAPGAIEGMENLIGLEKQAAKRICIMPGGGIRSGNISRLKDNFAGSWFHSAGITGTEATADAEEIRKLKNFR